MGHEEAKQRYELFYEGAEFKLDKLLQINEFYLRRYETENFFTQNCQTGDILLFEDTHFFAKAQRFFTRSDFGTLSSSKIMWQ